MEVSVWMPIVIIFIFGSVLSLAISFFIATTEPESIIVVALAVISPIIARSLTTTGAISLGLGDIAEGVTAQPAKATPIAARKKQFVELTITETFIVQFLLHSESFI